MPVGFNFFIASQASLRSGNSGCRATPWNWHCKFPFILFYVITPRSLSIDHVMSLLVCKQLLDEVFVISKIIKVEIRVISRSRRLRLITLTETLIILDITKTESNNCFIIHSGFDTWLPASLAAGLVISKIY